MSTVMPTNTRIQQLFGPQIASGGVAIVSTVLLDNQACLGLTSHELNYLLIVLAHWDGDDWPCMSVKAIAETTGAGERTVKTWRAQLVSKGWLVLRPRGRAGGGRGADEHDLSPLLAQLHPFTGKDRHP